MRNIEKMQEEIHGERLVILDRAVYTEDEERLMIETLVERATDPSYMFLIREKFDKIYKLCNKYCEDPEVGMGAIDILTQIVSIKKYGPTRLGEEISYSYYVSNINTGYRWDESYTEVIAQRIMNPDKINEAYKDGTAFDKYKSNTNFLITNNLLLTRYPGYFEENDLEQLKKIAKYRKMKELNGSKPYSEFRRAANITLKKVELIEKRRKNQAKRLMKEKNK